MTLAEAVERQCCVRVYSEDDAITLVRAMKSEFPQLTTRWNDDTRWDIYEEKTLYYLDFKGVMVYGSLNNVVTPYPMISFSDIDDFIQTELIESEFPIEFLM